METSSAGSHRIRVLDHAAQRLSRENARIEGKKGKVHDEYTATNLIFPFSLILVFQTIRLLQIMTVSGSVLTGHGSANDGSNGTIDETAPNG